MNLTALLCSYDTVTIWHLRDLMAGRRRRIKGTEIKYIAVPQYDGLNVKEFLTFALRYKEVMEALPSEEKEILKLPRS